MRDNPERNFSKFSKHIDNILENIKGKHINDIQDSVNDLEKDNIELHSRVFLDEAQFVLDNNPYVNIMHYIDLSDSDQIFRAESSNWEISSKEKCAKIRNNEMLGIIHTIALDDGLGNVNNVILKVDEEVNRGQSIKYYISNDMQNYHPIIPGASTPFEFESYEQYLYLKVELIANTKRESPNLYAVALLCHDNSGIGGLVIEEPGEGGETEPPVIPDCCKEYIGDLILTYHEDSDELIKIERADGTQITDLFYDEDWNFLYMTVTEEDKKIKTELLKDELDRVDIVRITEEEL
jgi:hypothetical protein